MRAKSIKNKARINAELSPAELKALLKKAQRDVGNYQNYISLVETELSTWRSGGSVDKAQWASMEKALGLQPGEAAALASKAESTPSGSGRATPRTPALDNLRDLESRPQTPSATSMDKDEREGFLQRENELTDQLSEKVGRARYRSLVQADACGLGNATEYSGAAAQRAQRRAGHVQRPRVEPGER